MPDPQAPAPSEPGALAAAALFDTLSWMSPAWPIGAYAHSGGIEWAVEAGLVRDPGSARAWLRDLLAHGPLRNDAALFVYAWRAARARDAERLRAVAELAAAAQTGHERRTEATAQGAAFRRIALGVLGCPPRLAGEGDHAQHGGGVSFLDAGSVRQGSPLHQPAAGPPPQQAGEDMAALLSAIADDDLAYPVAAAALFAARGVALTPALTAFLHGALANLVSAAQRLAPLGQTDAQRLLAASRDDVLAMVDWALALPQDGAPFDALGGCALVAELGCMAHETQYTRLFRT